MLFIALRGLGCADCSSVLALSACCVALKGIKCIQQAVEGQRARESISQEGHLGSAALLMEFFQEVAP